MFVTCILQVGTARNIFWANQKLAWQGFEIWDPKI